MKTRPRIIGEVYELLLKNADPFNINFTVLKNNDNLFGYINFRRIYSLILSHWQPIDKPGAFMPAGHKMAAL